MRKTRGLLVFLCLFTSLASVAFAASVSGVVYDESISSVKGAVVQVDRTQPQPTSTYGKIVTNQSGSYSFSLPAGTYNLTASVQRGESLETSVILSLSENDSVVMDLLLLPDVGADLPDIITPTDEGEFPSIVEEAQQTNILLSAVIIVLLAALAAAAYFIWKKQSEGRSDRADREAMRRQAEELRIEVEEIKRKKEEPPLGRFLTDEERVYQMIRRMGEVPQKHIVTETGFSKAKVTLILKKLEKLGRIERKSTGREKIIKAVE